MSQWLVGAALNLAGNIIINLGTNLIKLAHCQYDQILITTQHKSSFYQSKAWLWGVGCFALGNVGNFVSFGFASQSLLSGLSSVQFVSNVIFASLLFEAIISLRVILSTITIIAGNILIVIFANPNTKSYSASELWELYQNQANVVYMFTLLIMLITAQVLYQRVHSANVVRRANNQPPTAYQQRMLPGLYALVSAIVGAQSVMLSKDISILFKTSIGGSNQFENPTLYLIVVLWLSCMVFW